MPLMHASPSEILRLLKKVETANRRRDRLKGKYLRAQLRRRGHWGGLRGTTAEKAPSARPVKRKTPKKVVNRMPGKKGQRK